MSCIVLNVDAKVQALSSKEAMITVTNKYWDDLESAKNAGIYPANIKPPKKAALYEAISAHNDRIAANEAEDDEELDEPVQIAEDDRIGYTTADEGCDGFGTRTIEMTGYQDKRGREIRKIAMVDIHADWQMNRNGSCLHPTWTEEDFKKMVDLNLVVSIAPASEPEQSATPRRRITLRGL